MEHEQELMQMVKEKCIRNKQDIFIENAVHFFMKSQCNCCDWITESYSLFHSAVSYTHLDVYKRQGYGTGLRVEKGGPSSSGWNLNPRRVNGRSSSAVCREISGYGNFIDRILHIGCYR